MRKTKNGSLTLTNEQVNFLKRAIADIRIDYKEYVEPNMDDDNYLAAHCELTEVENILKLKEKYGGEIDELVNNFAPRSEILKAVKAAKKRLKVK